jgi:hypothetical protein
VPDIAEYFTETGVVANITAPIKVAQIKTAFRIVKDTRVI